MLSSFRRLVFFLITMSVISCSTPNMFQDSSKIQDLKEKKSRSVDIPPSDYRIKSFRFLVPDRGGRVDWHPFENNRVAFDLPGAEGFHDVYIMDINESKPRCLTCNLPELSGRENGNPEWHPSGKYIVFQSEEPRHYNLKDRWFPYPGIGGYANLWAVSVEDQRVFKLTDYKPFVSPAEGGDFGAAHSTLHPHFNDDGTRLVWTMRYDNLPQHWGKWKIVMADFIIGHNGPHLENIRDIFKPGPPGYFVECMGFRPGKNDELALNGNLEGQHEYGMDIYRYNLKTGEIRNLTNTPDIWEEDLVFTKNGDKILFMSNMASGPLNPQKEWTGQPRTREYYLMKAEDGRQLSQITHFNVKGWPEYRGGIKTTMSDCSFSPDGRRLVFLFHEDKSSDPKKASLALRIALIEFDKPVL